MNKMAKSLITFNEAVKFLENELKIYNIAERIQEEKHQILDEIIRSFYSEIAFTTFYLHSNKLPERKFPHPDSVVEEVLTKKAGTCSVLNGFFQKLLLVLGYESFTVSGEVLGGSIRNNHVVTLVRNLDNEGDLHYVDVGMGLPTFEAISLRDLPKNYTFAFHEMRMEKRDDKYVRCHNKKTEFENTTEKPTDWKPFLEFDTTPRQLDFFNDAMEEIYCTDKALLNKFILAYLYPKGRAITVRQLTLRIWDEMTKKIEETVFGTIEEAAEEISKNFPMIGKELILRAYTLWKELDIPEHFK